jgi:hypothetical protein
MVYTAVLMLRSAMAERKAVVDKQGVWASKRFKARHEAVL